MEGATILQVAAATGAEIEAVYLAPRSGPVELAAAEEARGRGARVFQLADGVLEKVAVTVTPQAVLAVVRQPPQRPDLLGRSTFTVVLAGVRDPGNAGTVVRSAAAAGAELVVVAAGSVDPFNPKTVRASAGAVLQVPLLWGVEPANALAELGAAGVARVGAVADGGRSHVLRSWREPVAVVLGNERAGLDPALEALLDDRVTIVMPGPVSSLNVSMAATVLCFEVARQRSNLNAVEDDTGRVRLGGPGGGTRA